MPFIEDCFIGQFILLDLEFIKWKKMCMYIAWCVNPLKLPDKFSKHCIWVCAFSEKVLSFQPVVSFLTPKFYRLSIIYLSVLYLHQGKSTVTSDINYIILNILEYFGFYLSLSQRITFFFKENKHKKTKPLQHNPSESTFLWGNFSENTAHPISVSMIFPIWKMSCIHVTIQQIFIS